MATIIDSTGFVRDRLDTIVANIEAAARAIFGDDIDLDPSSLDAQAIGAVSEGVADQNELLEMVYLSRSIAGATGAALSRLVQLVGISRNGASYSTADVVYSGTPGTLIPDGSLIDTTTVPAANFRTVGDVTIGADGTVPGTVRATTTGPVFGAAGAISVIKTIISGWATVTNAAAVNLGSHQELDAALRTRFRASVAINSKSVVDGIYAALANVQGVGDAAVFENKTGAPVARIGSSDLPPNSIQAVVSGGLDADIAAAIWAKASAGVTLVGATSYLLTDSQGIQQAIRFDRPVQTAIYAEIYIATPPGIAISQELQDAAKRALVDYGNSISGIGKNVYRAQYYQAVLDVVGNADQVSFSGLLLGKTPTVANLDLAIPFTSKASWDVGQVKVITINPALA